MKECKYCGTHYEDSLRACPSCGANVIVTARELAEEEELYQKEKENQQRAGAEPKNQLKKLIGIVAGVVAAIIIIVVAASYFHNHRAVNGDLSRADMAASYELGMTYFNNKDYISAITELGKVSEESKYYANASAMMQEATTLYSEDILSKAAEYASSGDYETACSILERALNALPESSKTELGSALSSYSGMLRDQLRTSTLNSVNASIAENDYPAAIRALSDALSSKLNGDIELSALLNKYSGTYRDMVIAQADAALESEGYEAAIAVANQGLNSLPNDTILLQAIEKYKQYKPVWLIDTDYYTGTEDRDCTIVYSEKDNSGNVYNNSIISGSDRVGNYWNYDFDRTYMVKGAYSHITGTIYQTYEARSKKTIKEHKLQIYGDGELLYEYRFSDGETGIKPINVDVSLKGIQELRVIFKGSCFRDGRVLSLGDVTLHP